MKRVRGVIAALVMSVAASVLTQGAAPGQQPQPPADPPMPAALKDYKAVTAERLRKPDDQDWLMIRRTSDGWRFRRIRLAMPKRKMSSGTRRPVS
jgi:hypothetical protein